MKPFYIIILFFLFLTACAPYVDTRREAGFIHPFGQSTKEVIAICYNGWTTSPSELLQIANLECQSHNIPAELIDIDYFNCRLFTPNTALYKCLKTTKP